jgi:hypothetical protein
VREIVIEQREGERKSREREREKRAERKRKCITSVKMPLGRLMLVLYYERNFLTKVYNI